MSEAIVVGLIADTSNPAAVIRLLGDLGRLATTDPGLSSVQVVVLENPSGEQSLDCALSTEGVTVHRIGRASQERDAARGRFGRVELPEGRLPIAVARTLVQRHAAERAVGGAAVWILDEDLRLWPLLDAVAAGEPPLSERMRRLRIERIDVAVGPIIGAPPLPARSTARVNLEDIPRHLDLVATLEPSTAWPDRSGENARVRRALPEFYYDLSRAHEDAGAHPMWIERARDGETVGSAFARLCAAVGGLLDGTPITRGIPESPALDAGRSPLARGGNTLVLRPALLERIPNVAPRLSGRVSRRSDMLWARLAAALEGARFGRAPITAFQDRSGPGRSSFDADKLLDDVRGSALVAALDALLERGELSRERDAVVRASAIYVDQVRERLEAVRRSEARAQELIGQIFARIRSREGLLAHPAHAGSIERLAAHASRLRTAYAPDLGGCDPEEERGEVEQFLSNLPAEVEAYRRCTPSSP